MDTAGAIIDAATAAGGDATVVNNLAFSIEDNAELLQMARTAAWADAEGKARQLAQLAGLELGTAISITESISYDTPPIYYERAMAAAEDGAVHPDRVGHPGRHRQHPGDLPHRLTPTVSRRGGPWPHGPPRIRPAAGTSGTRARRPAPGGRPVAKARRSRLTTAAAAAAVSCTPTRVGTSSTRSPEASDTASTRPGRSPRSSAQSRA